MHRNKTRHNRLSSCRAYSYLLHWLKSESRIIIGIDRRASHIYDTYPNRIETEPDRHNDVICTRWFDIHGDLIYTVIWYARWFDMHGDFICTRWFDMHGRMWASCFVNPASHFQNSGFSELPTSPKWVCTDSTLHGCVGAPMCLNNRPLKCWGLI